MVPARPVFSRFSRLWPVASLAFALTICERQDVARGPQDDDIPIFVLPPSPVPLDGVPAFGLQDIDADDFTRIPRAKSLTNASGKGLAVVVIDTGLNPVHVAFKDHYLPGCNLSGEGRDDDTTDVDGHGSQVAGLIAAREVDPKAVPADIEVPSGVAHEARIIPIKIVHDSHDSSNGRPPGDRINKALKWVIEHHLAVARDHKVLIGVVNLSVSLDNLQSPDPLDPRRFRRNLADQLKEQRRLIGKLRQSGVAVVASAGNSYLKWRCEQGMGYPAVCPETISVGAVFDRDHSYGQTGITYADGATVYEAKKGRCTPFTQRLGRSRGHLGATDVFAPGARIKSMGAFDPGKPQESCFAMALQDGTSLAAPIVAGVVLLMQQIYIERTRWLNPENPLPPVDLLEECLSKGGGKFNDQEEAPGNRWDNVRSCAEDFVWLDAEAACRYLIKRYEDDLAQYQLALRARRDAAGMKILGVPVPVRAGGR
jgi:subtilisin family serine protease